MDKEGFADLYKFPGILDFSPTLQPFQRLELVPGVEITALPLQHSRPTLGYLIEVTGGKALAYLTDTGGLASEVIELLRDKEVDYLMIDCSFDPTVDYKLHNNLDQALALVPQLQAKEFYLTHIDHSLRYVFNKKSRAIDTGCAISPGRYVLRLSLVFKLDFAA
ncbi:hypothetical protein OURE66S_03111 [Oligella ureolytica]